jgi:hypothetical protein
VRLDDIGIDADIQRSEAGPRDSSPAAQREWIDAMLRQRLAYHEFVMYVVALGMAALLVVGAIDWLDTHTHHQYPWRHASGRTSR